MNDADQKEQDALIKRSNSITVPKKKEISRKIDTESLKKWAIELELRELQLEENEAKFKEAKLKHEALFAEAQEIRESNNKIQLTINSVFKEREYNLQLREEKIHEKEMALK